MPTVAAITTHAAEPEDRMMACNRDFRPYFIGVRLPVRQIVSSQDIKSE
jgi:hypothetical protein